MGLPLAEYGKTLKKRFFENVRYSLIFVPQLGRIQTGQVNMCNQKPLTFWILPCELRGDGRFNGFVLL